MTINVNSVTEVQVANFAIARIGGERIEAFDPPEDSTESHQVNLWFHHCRRLVLELYDWNFARKRLALAEDSNAPPDEWAYRYQYPADGIALRGVENPSTGVAEPVQRQIEVPTSPDVKTILSNLQDMVVIYTANMTSTSIMPSSFIEVWHLCLAERLCPNVKGDEKLKDTVKNEWKEWVAWASALNANQNKYAPARDASWIEAR